MSRKRRRGKAESEAPKPLSARAADILADLEDIEDSAWLVRCFRRWWYRDVIIATAMEALEAVSGHDKMLEKLRKAVAIQVTTLGGPQIDWAKQATKKGAEE